MTDTRSARLNKQLRYLIARCGSQRRVAALRLLPCTQALLSQLLAGQRTWTDAMATACDAAYLRLRGEQ